MLRTRVITALVLFFTFLAALFRFSPLGWMIFTTGVMAVAAWEWGALLRLSGGGRWFFALFLILICAVIAWLEPAALALLAPASPRAAWHLGQWLYWPAAVFWFVGVPLWLWRRWALNSRLLGLALGLLLLLPAWLAMIQLRQVGPWALLAIMMIVWLADTGAYFAGRRWGRHKLAPNISPGKTWEGAAGGAVAVIVYGFVLSFYFPDVLSAAAWRLLVALIVVTGVSIIGDLLESLLKRQAGLKDSSNILPGHGGLLDRIDSLTSTLPIVALFWLAVVN